MLSAPNKRFNFKKGEAWAFVSTNLFEALVSPIVDSQQSPRPFNKDVSV